MRFLVPDTSLVWNFHAVGRIDLISSFVGRAALAPSRAEWGLEVEQEVLHHISDAHDALHEIFGDAVRPTPSQRSTTHFIRERAFRGIAEDPRAHVGESEAIAIWSDIAAIGDTVLCLTEDKAFVRFCWRTHDAESNPASFAGGRCFVPVTSADVLASCVAAQKISEAESGSLQQAMKAADRPCIGPARNLL